MKKLALLLVLAAGTGGLRMREPSHPNRRDHEFQRKLGGPAVRGNNAPVSDLNFVTSFNITNTTGFPEPLDVTGFGFFNSGPCFDTGLTKETEVGTATLNTNNAGQVTGSLTFTVTSVPVPGNVLTLTTSPNGALTGTSNGTTTTTGTLSQGVVVGSWTLKSWIPAAIIRIATDTSTFLMCQGVATCTPPA